MPLSLRRLSRRRPQQLVHLGRPLAVRAERTTLECTYRTFTNANGCELREYCVNECERAHTHRANSVAEV